MVVGCFGHHNDTVKDYSFVKEELKNLKGVPRDFDPELYKKLGISDTVIAYWREIGYIPSYSVKL